MKIVNNITVMLTEEDIKEAIVQYVNKYSSYEVTMDSVFISHQEHGEDGIGNYPYTEYKATIVEKENLVNL